MEDSLTIISVTCSDHSIHQIRHFISGLYCQTDPNWKCKIYYDRNNIGDYKCYTEKSDLGIDYTYDYYHSGSIKYDYDPRIEFIIVDPAKGSFGNHNRLTGLMETDTEWIHFSNADNQYCPKFVETVRSHTNDCDFLGFCINHNYAHGKFYEVLDPEPVLDSIDYMSFVVKTKLMKEIGFPCIDFSGNDGIIAQELIKRGARWKKIKAILGTHN